MIELTELSRIRREAKELLTSLTTQALIIEKLRPQAGDFARVFKADAVNRATEGYNVMWNAPPPSFGKAGQTEVLTWACDTESLANENEFSDAFPGGYRKIAHLLQPGLVWVAFKFVEPGRTTGMSYDGLVRIGERWAWFPKPFRFLAEATDETN
jgi:hypothetical protein